MKLNRWREIIMLKNFFKLFVFLLALNCAFAVEVDPAKQKINVDLQGVNLPDALHFFAKALNLNVVLNPEVSGVVSLRLHNVSAERALDLILYTHGLAKISHDGVWLIGPQADLIHQEQESAKLQEVQLIAAALQTRVWQIHYAKADNIAHLLQDTNGSVLSKRGSVHVDLRTNEVYVQDTAEKITAVAQLIRRLDVPVQQVEIETKLVSIDSDYERTLGVDFTVVPDELDATQVAAAAVKRYSLAVAKLADGSLLDMRLAALENEGHGELISSPHLFTANQQTASIESGEEIPYQEVSRSGGTAVAFKKAVLSLQVTPQIFPDRHVLLQLQINQDRPNNRLVQGVPAISTRQISTHILARNGQTVVLGGIFESNKDELQQRIPFLGTIPVVGWLFRQQNRIESKRELLIFVTPKIVDTVEK